MITAHREEAKVGEDGTIVVKGLPFAAGEDVEVIVLPRFATAPGARTPRPFGLCRGEFVVPDDFDVPLPDAILDAFAPVHR